MREELFFSPRIPNPNHRQAVEKKFPDKFFYAGWMGPERYALLAGCDYTLLPSRLRCAGQNPLPGNFVHHFSPVCVAVFPLLAPFPVSLHQTGPKHSIGCAASAFPKRQVGTLRPGADGSHAIGHLADCGTHRWSQRHCGGEMCGGMCVCAACWSSGGGRVHRWMCVWGGQYVGDLG